MVDNFDYNGSARLGVGQIALGDFDETYELRQFPRQDDQPGIVDWLPPLDGSDVYGEFVETVESMDASAGTWGNGDFDWFLGYWTPHMTKYFLDTFFPDGAGSALVTVMTFDAGYGWRVVWATARRPNLKEAERVGDGYNRVKVSFLDAEAAS